MIETRLIQLQNEQESREVPRVYSNPDDNQYMDNEHDDDNYTRAPPVRFGEAYIDSPPLPMVQPPPYEEEDDFDEALAPEEDGEAIQEPAEPFDEDVWRKYWLELDGSAKQPSQVARHPIYAFDSQRRETKPPH